MFEHHLGNQYIMFHSHDREDNNMSLSKSEEPKKIRKSTAYPLVIKHSHGRSPCLIENSSIYIYIKLNIFSISSMFDRGFILCLILNSLSSPF